jgi:hypothetical protein
MNKNYILNMNISRYDHNEQSHVAKVFSIVASSKILVERAFDLLHGSHLYQKLESIPVNNVGFQKKKKKKAFMPEKKGGIFVALQKTITKYFVTV